MKIALEKKLVSRSSVDLTRVVQVDGWLRFDTEHTHPQFTHGAGAGAGAGMPARRPVPGPSKQCPGGPHSILEVGCRVPLRAVPLGVGGSLVTFILLLCFAFTKSWSSLWPLSPKFRNLIIIKFQVISIKGLIYMNLNIKYIFACIYNE